MIIDATISVEARDHWDGQSEGRHKLMAIGIESKNIQWISAQGNRTHTYRVKCTEKEAVMIKLLATEVSTKHYETRVSQIKKYEESIKKMQDEVIRAKEEILWEDA